MRGPLFIRSLCSSSARRRQIHTGTLHVVATPIGCAAGDLTLRARNVLLATPIIAAEDTRVVRALLKHHSIPDEPKHIICCNEHSEREGRAAWIVGRLLAGHDVALVCDAGTPAISDPGDGVVRAVRNAGLRITPVPGPCAAIAALSVAGLATSASHGGSGALILGFLPDDLARRGALLAEIAVTHAARAVVLYEAPSRVAATIADLHGVHENIGNVCRGNASTTAATRALLVCREMTKPHEELRSFASLADAAHAFSSEVTAQPARGEFTLVLSPALPMRVGETSGDSRSAAAAAVDDEDLRDAVYAVVELSQRLQLPTHAAVKRVSEASGIARKLLYRAVAESGGARGGRGAK